ncbi:MAG: hypothetical protein ACKPKO_56520, partial [Candidatus Fonsibacter sp.]
ANMARVTSVSEVMPFNQACATCPSGAPSRSTAMSFAVANKAGNHNITRPKGLLNDAKPMLRCPKVFDLAMALHLIAMPLEPSGEDV